MAQKILIVEDEKPIAKALELKLTHSGLDAKAAFNGEEAIKLLEQEKFDLVLLDLIMPNMDGFAVLQNLKDKNIKVRVIVTSNLSQEEDVKKAKELGAIDYFVKSDTSLSKIVDYIQTALKNDPDPGGD
ncbi:MAG: response regulator [bacterium]